MGPNDRPSIRTGLDADTIALALVDNLHYLQAKLPAHATPNDWYMALAYTVRERLLDRYIRTVTSARNRRLISRMISRCRGSSREKSGTGHFSSASERSV